ncbi:hypothetical protein LR48_Vigan01g316000 [Vigna angularis]|uniref:Uncharacterized protein n=1 Tax=Phaseolus angularis TaxID=3914 RepID=A0A0L9TTV0_PHAAN|nr:hypothetical protein LR48_Vigan01g316000 [Vigna angularis]
MCLVYPSLCFPPFILALRAVLGHRIAGCRELSRLFACGVLELRVFELSKEVSRNSTELCSFATDNRSVLAFGRNSVRSEVTFGLSQGAVLDSVRPLLQSYHVWTVRSCPLGSEIPFGLPHSQGVRSCPLSVDVSCLAFIPIYSKTDEVPLEQALEEGDFAA